MQGTKYQIAWWDRHVILPDKEGWKLMPSQIFASKKEALGELHRMKSRYPGIPFSIQRITTEIVAQAN